jgi:2-oxoglutarate ferredoxin oxidoreductase subunit alpha
VPPMACFGDGYRWFVSGIIHDDTGFPVTNSPDMISASIDHMLGKISDNMGDIQAWEEYRTEDADIVMLSAGLVSRSAKSAIDAARSEGIKIGLFRPITLWPFPEARFGELCEKARTVMTCEMNEGQLAEIAAKFTDRSQKLIPVTQNNGTMIRADRVLAAIREAN